MAALLPAASALRSQRMQQSCTEECGGTFEGIAPRSEAAYRAVYAFFCYALAGLAYRHTSQVGIVGMLANRLVRHFFFFG